MIWKTLQQDLSDIRWIYVKGFGFLLAGVFASLLIVLETLSLKVLLLHLVALWCFCRFYYFAFYVIQHYVDDRYKFSGLLSFVFYLLRNRGSNSAVQDASDAHL